MVAWGGLGKLLGPTGGYILGYLAAAILIALLKGKKGSVIRYAAVAIVAGMPVIYLLGMGWMKVSANMDWNAAFVSSVLPFIPLDMAKCTKGYAYGFQKLGALYFKKSSGERLEDLIPELKAELFAYSYEKIWEELTTPHHVIL